MLDVTTTSLDYIWSYNIIYMYIHIFGKLYVHCVLVSCGNQQSIAFWVSHIIIQEWPNKWSRPNDRIKSCHLDPEVYIYIYTVYFYVLYLESVVFVGIFIELSIYGQVNKKNDMCPHVAGFKVVEDFNARLVERHGALCSAERWVAGCFMSASGEGHLGSSMILEKRPQKWSLTYPVQRHMNHMVSTTGTIWGLNGFVSEVWWVDTKLCVAQVFEDVGPFGHRRARAAKLFHTDAQCNTLVLTYWNWAVI